MKEYIELNELRQKFFDIVNQMDSDALHIDAIIDIIEDMPTVGWISVEDRLPAFDQRVLAFVTNKDPKCRFNPDGVYVAELKNKTPKHDMEGKKNFWRIPGYDSEWTVWAWSYFSEPCVTHWMPLPNPPEVKE